MVICRWIHPWGVTDGNEREVLAMPMYIFASFQLSAGHPSTPTQRVSAKECEGRGKASPPEFGPYQPGFPMQLSSRNGCHSSGTISKLGYSAGLLVANPPSFPWFKNEFVFLSFQSRFPESWLLCWLPFRSARETVLCYFPWDLLINLPTSCQEMRFVSSVCCVSFVGFTPPSVLV